MNAPSCLHWARFSGVKGPGLIFIFPVIQQLVRVDLRTVVMDVPSQDVISQDNVSVSVNAVIYFRVIDAERAIIQVETIHMATSQLRRPRCDPCWVSTISTKC
jgi:regulator of protease activity HflC (stomatin/prohibitin superfamily)